MTAQPPREDLIRAIRTGEDEAHTLNREIQWLEFNDRVLRQAGDDRIPLLERVRFLSIFASNLDEFFMKRVGGLRRQMLAGVGKGYEGQRPADVMEAIRARVIPMMREKTRIFRDALLPALRDIGVELINYSDLTHDEIDEVRGWYRRAVFPVLTPLAIDPGHRFPFISNLSVSLGVMLRRPGDPEPLFARVKVPEVVEQWRRVGSGNRFVTLVDVIENNLEDLFPGMEILNVLPFRITRNADVDHDDEDADDLLEQIQAQLRERRFAPVVRLQVRPDPPRELLKFVREELEIQPDDIYESEAILDYQSLDQIASVDAPEHTFPSWSPVTPPRLADREKDIFSVIREGDILVHNPYESFDESATRFITEASRDPNVLCIKMTLYRTSGHSEFVRALIRAAESGVQVAVLVELRARFDEARNIAWAQKLEDAGVHVAYGVVGLKTHTKTALVVRREGDRIRAYAHIGTGNYNASTARVYDDVALLTCDPILTDDIVHLFNAITGRALNVDYRRLLIAPHAMKPRFLELIEREIDAHARTGRGRIVAKMNQLQDREVIEALYAASVAGVQVDLIVRGFCTLRPGVPGLSENIRVSSIVGRFLEHSRIFYFAGGEADPLDGSFYIGSADWMYRNLHARVEAVCPIEVPELKARLWEILDLALRDHRTAWDMAPDGRYTRRHADAFEPESDEAIGLHEALMRLARERSRK